jgi:hypothetical protein
MDLRTYFRKIREIEASISEDCPIVVSLETADGGRAGVLNEVSRTNAAALIFAGRAVLASAEQAEDYRKNCQDEYRFAQEREELYRVGLLNDSGNNGKVKLRSR